jgi:hypothetical protein
MAFISKGHEGSECLTIFNQLKQIYEGRMKKIDDELGRDGTEVKMGVT